MVDEDDEGSGAGGAGDDDDDDVDVDGDDGEDGDGDDDDDDDEAEEDIATVMENTYYSAKGSVNTDLDEAIEMFNLVLDMEEEKGQWGFKTLKQIIKAYFKHGKFEDMIDKYRALLEYMNVVSRNDSEKAINNILSMVSSSSSSSSSGSSGSTSPTTAVAATAATNGNNGNGGVVDQKLLSNMYQITLDALKEANNEVCHIFNVQCSIFFSFCSVMC